MSREPIMTNGQVDQTIVDEKTIHIAWDYNEKHFYAIKYMKQFMFNESRSKIKYCFYCYKRYDHEKFRNHFCHSINTSHDQCDLCKQLFFNKELFNDHLKKESGGFACDCCARDEFRGIDCFELHKNTNCFPPDHFIKVKCEGCGYPHLQGVPHECRKYFQCKFCDAQFTAFDHLRVHLCYFTNNKQMKKAHNNMVNTVTNVGTSTRTTYTPHWFYDFETCRDVEVGTNKYRHKVMAWCMKLICLPSLIDTVWKNIYQNMCNEIKKSLDGCPLNIQYRETESDEPGMSSFMITGTDFPTFMTLVFQYLKGKNMHPTLWAHNGSKFDGKFVLHHILNEWNFDLAGDCYIHDYRLAPKPKVQKMGEETETVYEWKKVTHTMKKKNICSVSMIGSRALSIKASDVTFRCSHAHFSAPLSKLPRAFGFKDTLRKGEFPYGRLSETAWGSVHVDGLPPLEEYKPDAKKPEVRLKLIQWWYKEQERRNASNYVNVQVRRFIPDFPCTHVYDGSKPTEPWRFNEELWQYLYADVDVGARALHAYHTTAIEMQQEICTLSNNGTKHRVLSPLQYATSPAWAKDMWQLYFMPDNEVVVLASNDAQFIRNSLHGGRTDKRATIVKLTDEAFERGDRIQYYDFKSLYPSVQKCSVHGTYYPQGPARWDYSLLSRYQISNQFLLEYMQNKTGFLSISAKHLKYVTHPTLCRMKDTGKTSKLIFSNQDTVNETYAWPEIEEAIRCGEIEVTQVHKAVVFERTTKTFNSYVDFFFKVKEQAEQDGNEGLRSLAKLLLNSLWGKLGQNSYATKEWVTTEERKLYLQKQFESGEYQLVSFLPKGDGMLHFEYRIKNDFNNLGTTAVHIAAHVSMWGRVMLHRKVLSIHGQRALYSDTDSAVIYVRKNDTIPYVGNDLGDLTSEVPKILKDGGVTFTGEAFIREAVFVAPKTYALHIQTTCGKNYYKVVCKGFEPSYENSKSFHFENFKKLMIDKSRKRTRSNDSSDEEERMKFIKGAPTLRFDSSMKQNEISPIESYVVKKLSGDYDKGTVHPGDDRLIIPFGDFEPTTSFLIEDDPLKHYE